MSASENRKKLIKQRSLQNKKRLEEIKKKKEKRQEEMGGLGGAQYNKRKNYGNNQIGDGNKKKTTGKKLTGAERAKALAKKNIKKYGGTAKAAAANKEAMRLKIRQRYLANKKKKK